ncbi:MAG: C40 family peptidase, partial [Nocardioidaceae bacterium]
AGPSSFDCSGLTSYAYAKAGISLPRTSGAQAAKARNVSRKNMRRGDLVFFHSGGDVYHVGIYWGRNNGHRLILDAPRPGDSVGFTRIWTNSWFPGRVGPKAATSAPKIKSIDKRDERRSGKSLGAMSLGAMSR